MEFYFTDKAPNAVGPYSQAVSCGGFLYASGQAALDPKTGKLVEGGFAAQARQTLANIRAVLASAGLDMSDIVKTTIFVTDLKNFPILNELYAEAMGDHRPARSTVEVSALPVGAMVEIEAIARMR